MNPAENESSPEELGGVLHKLQPHPRGAQALAEFDQTPDGEAVDRLEHDRALHNHLMWSGFAGREWDTFRSVLAGYGFQVLTAWTVSGRVFTECRRKRRTVRPPHAPLTHDDAQELAAETVARAIVYFRERVLVPGLWNPERKASLRTFFIGACILQFPRVYRAWLRQTLPLPFADVSTDRLPAPSSNAVQRVQLRELFEGSDPLTAKILQLTAIGYEQDEVGERVGKTRKAVEHRLRRFRAKVA